MSDSQPSAPRGMRDRLKRLASQDLSLAVLGHGSEKALGAVVSFAVLFALSKGELAFYGAALNVLMIASKISDLGLDASLLRALSRAHRAGDSELERALLRAAFVVKVGTSLLAFGVGWLISPWLAGWLDHSGLTPFLRLGFLGVLGKQVTGLLRAMFASRLEFGRNALFVTLGPGFWLLGLTVAWLWAGSLGPEACLAACVGGPLASCCLVTVWSRKLLLGPREQGLRPLRAVFQFSRWIYLAEVLGIVRSKIGAFVLLAVISADASGVYDQADRLASLVTVLTNAMMTVMIPKASRLNDLDEMRGFLGKARRFIPLVLLGIPFGLLLSRALGPLLESVRPDLADIPPLFGILLASMLVSVAAYPAYSLLYALHKPQVHTAIELLMLPVTVGLLYVLVPRYGAFGTAWAMFIQRGISASLYIGYVEWSLRPGAKLDDRTPRDAA